MKQEIPWGKFAVEAFVIVGSILLAFVIDAWWEARREGAQAAQYKALLRTQMVSNRQILVEDVDRAQRARESLDVLILEMSPSPDDIGLDSVLTLVRPGLTMSSEGLEASALESVLTSDYVDLDRDSTLHRLLVEFRSRSSIRMGNLDRWAVIRNRVLDRLGAVAPIASMYISEAGGQFSVPAENVLSDFELQGLFAQLQSRHVIRVQRSEALRDVVDGILAEIDEAEAASR